MQFVAFLFWRNTLQSEEVLISSDELIPSSIRKKCRSCCGASAIVVVASRYLEFSFRAARPAIIAPKAESSENGSH